MIIVQALPAYLNLRIAPEPFGIRARSIRSGRQQRAATRMQSFFDSQEGGVEWSLLPGRLAQEAPTRYSTKDWYLNLLSLHKAPTLRRLRNRLAVHTLLSLLIALLAASSPPIAAQLRGFTAIPHQLLTFSLGLLLVFRTNTAYDRYWEGRKTWGLVVGSLRVLSTFAHRSLDTLARKHLLSLLTAFPHVFLQHMLIREEKKDKEAHIRMLFAKLDAEDAKLLVGTENGPLMLCHMILGVTTHALNNPHRIQKFMNEEEGGGVGGGGGVTDAERALWTMVDAQNLALRAMAEHQNHNLIQCTSSAERIVKSTVSRSYSRHTSRFITLWCLTLPVALIDLQWRMVPVVLGICWALFTIEEVGHIIEDPFNIPFGDDNCMNLQPTLQGLEKDILQGIPATKGAEIPGLPPWMQEVYGYHERYRRKHACE